MDIESKSWLFDIATAITEINTFLESVQDVKAYGADLKTKRAVERNIEIIGEAVSRILAKKGFIHLSNARKIVDTRNRIIHGYDTVSDEIIWAIIKQYLPLRKQEVDALLDS